MINIFGGNYDEIGSTNKNLILKTQGKIKILWGKKFIDLIDNDGNINSKLLKLINKVNSLDDISKDGFYIYDGSLYVKYGDDILPLLNLDSDALYVSFVTEQETTSELKYTALKNLGLVYPTLSNVNNIPTNGIIYNEYDKSLYIVDNGILSKYYLEIPNPYTKLFIIAKEGDGNGALVINGEGIENSLYFNDLQIYNQQAYAYYKSLKDHKFYVGNQSVVDITGSGIETNEIKSKGFSYDTGYAILQEGSDYILYIDDIHVRKGIKAEAVKNIIPVRIYKEENVIIDSKVVETITQTVEQSIILIGYKLNLFFKYDNNYLVGDKLKIYVETPDKTNNEVNKVYSIDLEVMTTHTGSTKLNYITVDYTINSNYPDNVLEYFNNSICYLYSRKEIVGYDENDGEPIYGDIKNEDLVIGDLSGYNASHTGYGIISKNNKFYSAIFDKNKDIVELDETYKSGLFPVYSQELYDRLGFHYDDQGYEKVIPPLGIINELNKDYYIGTCDISGQNKIITLSPSTTLKFNIRPGIILKVIFSVDNTYDATVALPVKFIIKYNERANPEDLNENIYDYFPSLNTSIPVYYMNTIKLGRDKSVYGENGKSITYIYDGTYWNWLSGGSDATLNPILNDINILNEQDIYMPRDSINNTSNNHNSTYHRDYIFTYAGVGLDSNDQEIYKYRWIPILKDENADNEIPSKGLLIYNPTQSLNKIRVVKGNPNNNDQYLTCKDSDFKWSNIVTMLTTGSIVSPQNKQYLKYNEGELQWDDPLPSPPNNGDGYLKCTVNGNTITYSWDTPANGNNLGVLLNGLLASINTHNTPNSLPSLSSSYSDGFTVLVYRLDSSNSNTSGNFFWRELYQRTSGIIYNVDSFNLKTLKEGIGYLKNTGKNNYNYYNNYKWEIPENINYQNLDYLIFDIISSGTIIFNKGNDVSGNLLYFINNESTSWNDYDYNDNNGITVDSGYKLFLKGNLVTNNTDKSIGTFGGTAEFNVSGNIKALTDNNLHYYAELFKDCLNIRSAKNLYLPNPSNASNLSIYNNFFYNSSVNYVKVYSNYSNQQYTNFITSSNILNKIFVKPSDSNWDYNTSTIINGVTSDWKILTHEEEKLNDLLPKASGSGYILTTDNDGMWKIVQNLTLVNNNP